MGILLRVFLLVLVLVVVVILSTQACREAEIVTQKGQAIVDERACGRGRGIRVRGFGGGMIPVYVRVG